MNNKSDKSFCDNESNPSVVINDTEDKSCNAENGKPDCGKREGSHKISKKHILIYSIIALVFTIAATLCLIFLPSYLYNDGARGGVKIAGTVTSIISIYLLLMLSLAAVYFARVKRREKNRTFSSKNITRTAVFSALAIVLYYFVKFPVPAVFPSFLDIQFSDLPALLAGFMMGPMYGMIVIVIKFVVKLPASGTIGIGETIDLLLGISFVLTASIIYRNKRNLKGAVISLVIGSLVCTFVAALANRFIAVPAYITLMFSGKWDYLLGAMNAIFGGKVTEENFYLYYIFLSVIPFNLLRCAITSLLTFLLYKNLKRLFDKITN